MKGPVEDKKAVQMGEKGSLCLKEGVEVGDETSANLFLFFSKWNFKGNRTDIGSICYLQS